MLAIKSLKLKKGHILIYVLLIGLMCMTSLALCFKIIMDEKKSLYNFESFTLKENDEQRYKEYNLTYLTEYILNNINPLSKTQISTYFSNYGDKPIISFEHSYIKYNKAKDCFSLFYYYDENVIKENDYKYDITNNKVAYSYFNSSYVNGRI